MGLAGLVLIEDIESNQLMLPKQWGIDDVPLIIQDKRFSVDGQIDYQLDIMSAAVGWFGDTLLCNGVNYPQHSNPQGWLRLRLLNGCNARLLNIAASDNRSLYVIASDGGQANFPQFPIAADVIGAQIVIRSGTNKQHVTRRRYWAATHWHPHFER